MGVYVYKWGIEKDFEKRENSLPVKNIDKFDYITIKKKCLKTIQYMTMANIYWMLTVR